MMPSRRMSSGVEAKTVGPVDFLSQGGLSGPTVPAPFNRMTPFQSSRMPSASDAVSTELCVRESLSDAELSLGASPGVTEFRQSEGREKNLKHLVHSE